MVKLTQESTINLDAKKQEVKNVVLDACNTCEHQFDVASSGDESTFTLAVVEPVKIVEEDDGSGGTREVEKKVWTPAEKKDAMMTLVECIRRGSLKYKHKTHWSGNSNEVALGHLLDVREAHTAHLERYDKKSTKLGTFQIR